MNGELPEPWASELGPKGIHSYRALGRAADVGHETARRLVLGGRTSVGTVNQVADTLFGGDRDKVWSLHGVNVNDHGDWSLPAEASLLTEKQREAIRAVIQAMTPAIEAPTPKPAEQQVQPSTKLGRDLKRIKESVARDNESVVDESTESG